MTQKSRKKNAKTDEASIQINLKWCKRCGICIEFCPRGVFETADDLTPVVAHPEKCTVCGLCAMLCPDFAISGVERDESDAD